MPTILLGRNQTLSLDGSVLEGTREIDIDVQSKTVDVTGWDHVLASTLTLSQDITIKLVVYGQEDHLRINSGLSVEPPQPMNISVSNLGSADFVPVSVRITPSITGVVAWEWTFKSWNYQ